MNTKSSAGVGRKWLAALVIGFLTCVAIAQAPSSFKFYKFEFRFPAKWEVLPVTPDIGAMRAKAPSADGKDSAEVLFFVSTNVAPGVAEGIIDGWLNKFVEGKSKIHFKEQPVQLASYGAVIYSAEGTYKENSTALEKEGYGFSCALLSGEGQNLLIRAIGPTNAINTVSGQIYQMMTDTMR